MAPASDWGKDTGLLNSGVSALRDPAMSELCGLTAVERGADGVCASNFADVIKMLGLIDDVDGILDVLGALVLKGAAYVEDFRDRDRHLDDAAVLACAVTDPIGDRARMIGSDRRRIEVDLIPDRRGTGRGLDSAERRLA